MSAPDAVVAAILDDVQTAFTTFAVVWPNESFDPANPPASGHLGGFSSNADHAFAQVDFLAAAQESMGPSAGGRSRDGALVFWSRCARGTGPKAALVLAKGFEQRYRGSKSILSGEIEFGEPLSEEVGEVDGWYVWRTTCPFYQLTTSA